MDQPSLVVWTATCTFFGGLLLKIVFDWLKKGHGKHFNNPFPAKIPHAKNGFLAFSEITLHCKNQQEICTKLIKAEFKNIKLQINGRFERGSRRFESIEKRLSAIEEMSESHLTVLNSVNLAVQKLAKTNDEPMEVIEVKEYEL